MSGSGIIEKVFYMGRFEHHIEGSRRLMIPKEWRSAGTDSRLFALPWPIREAQHLLVLPTTRLSALVDRFVEMPLSDQRAESLERELAGNCRPMFVDKIGRICLPEDLAELAGITKKALLVGRLDKFEIWDPGRFERATPENKQKAADAIQSLKL